MMNSGSRVVTDADVFPEIGCAFAIALTLDGKTRISLVVSSFSAMNKKL